MPTHPDAPKQNTFSAGAALRIWGKLLDLEAITRELGLNPTYTHRQGEADRRGHIYPHEMWSLSSPVGSDQELELHFVWLAERILPHKEYILSLKQAAKVDIYCYKNCYTEQASLTLSSRVLKLFVELDFELGVSLIFVPDEIEETL